MKQNSKKSQERHKIVQNHLGNGKWKAGGDLEQTSHVKCRQLVQLSSEIPFKKQEVIVKYRQKQCATDPTAKSQAYRKTSLDQLKTSTKKDLIISQKSAIIHNREPDSQQEQNDNVSKQKKTQRTHKQLKNNLQLKSTINDSSVKQQFVINNSKQSQKLAKKQAKLLKKLQKEKQASHELKDSSFDSPTVQKKQVHNFPPEIISFFKQKHPYYLINDHITFPIEDTIFDLYPQLAEQAQSVTVQKSAYSSRLSNNFNKELQIWNMIVQHPAFFVMTEEVSIEEVSRILRNQNSQQYRQLFKYLHTFFLNDVLFHRYEQFASEQYYPFVSLWRYAQQNSFMDKLFQTSWNKFMHFYICLQKTNYKLQETVEESQAYTRYLQDSIQKGLFTHPKPYGNLLDYLIYLNNTSFQTITFKTLINNKMMFFRDNNKAKNEMLEQKKNFENKLWELKQTDKSILKKEKTIAKTIKKQQKVKNQEQVDKLIVQLAEINQQKLEITQKRNGFNSQITQIENKIYQLCCLPQFSNVWLLGQDRARNLYWFIKEQDNAIYREDKQTGEWFIISNNNIDVFHNTLNQRGIREKKLFQKILYYKQLGYIKTDAITLTAQDINQQNYEAEQHSSEMKSQEDQRNDLSSYLYDVSQFDKFVYAQYAKITPHIIKLMILKSEWMMTKYLYERNSKWTPEQNRNQYISKMLIDDFSNLEVLTQELRTFNQKICVVEINIKVLNQSDAVDLKTRKIQTKIWGINEKYKHFWYDYSRKCKTMSDLHFLVSVLYLTIEKYVTKTRKPNNTKYFFKTVEFGQANDQLEQVCDICKNIGQLQMCVRCESYFHEECLMRHQQNDGCAYKGPSEQKFCIFD